MRKIYKKISIYLILIIMCSILCGFVNKPAYNSYFIASKYLPVPNRYSYSIAEKNIVFKKDLYIPKIGVNSNIYPDISYMHLGICYWRNTIIGHNNNKTGFNKLKLLQIEDILFYKNSKYVLSNIKILNREQGNLIVNSKYSLILVTCHYVDNDKKRLILYYEEEVE